MFYLWKSRLISIIIQSSKLLGLWIIVLPSCGIDQNSSVSNLTLTVSDTLILPKDYRDNIIQTDIGASTIIINSDKDTAVQAFGDFGVTVKTLEEFAIETSIVSMDIVDDYKRLIITNTNKVKDTFEVDSGYFYMTPDGINRHGYVKAPQDAKVIDHVVFVNRMPNGSAKTVQERKKLFAGISEWIYDLQRDSIQIRYLPGPKDYFTKYSKSYFPFRSKIDTHTLAYSYPYSDSVYIILKDSSYWVEAGCSSCTFDNEWSFAESDIPLEKMKFSFYSNSFGPFISNGKSLYARSYQRTDTPLNNISTINTKPIEWRIIFYNEKYEVIHELVLDGGKYMPHWYFLTDNHLLINTINNDDNAESIWVVYSHDFATEL